MSIVIKVENLSKRYRLGLKESRKDTLMGQIGQTLRAPLDNFRRLRSMTRFDQEDDSVYWALRDINFEVKQGEVLGIIGHNGAGKSTLLKILSRITEPTDGRVLLNGRIAALLEVGTGFHQDLTGRENIYMNGTILGMTRKEIDRKLDEIVDFSGVEKHLDTPVKFYSSGMKVRLGFAVAAHLEPDILIIDEVLAVGDAEFQKKCLGKMESVAGEGRTVLFVSHDMGAVRNLCTRGVLLKNGIVDGLGSINEIVEDYLQKVDKKMGQQRWITDTSQQHDACQLREVRVANSNLIVQREFDLSEKIAIYIEYEVLMKGAEIWVGFQLFNKYNVNIFDSHNVTSVMYDQPHEVGEYRTIAWIPNYLLAEGQYYLNVSLFNHSKGEIYLYVKEVVSFVVIDDKNILSLNPKGKLIKRMNGLVSPLLEWENI